MSNNAYAPQQQQSTSNGLSITALVLGVLSIVLGILAAIPGIIVGHIARSKAKNNPQQYGGGGMALAGLILSYAVLILTVVMAYMVFNNPEMQEMVQQAMEQAKQAQEAMPAQ